MATAPLAMESTSDSLDKVTELLWEDALRHLKSTNNEVLLPSNVTDIIGKENLDKIKARLCNLIDAPVVAFVDESIDALRVMRTPAFSGTTVSVASHDRAQVQTATGATKPHEKPLAQGKTGKVPRPPNAFILYRQQHHPEIKAAYPDFCNNDISIILGKQWKDEPDDIKAQYKAQAEELKRQHARDHPDYQYTPRKPSEKKRRASSRQHPRHASMLRAGGSPTSTTSNASTPVLPPGFQQGHGQGQGSAAGDMQAPMSMSMPMQMQMQMRGDGGDGMNVVLGPNDAVSEQAFGLDAEAFSALVQQVNNGGGAGRVGAGGSASGGSSGDGRYWMYHGLNSAAGAEQAAADSFEFSDFITDFY